MNLETRCSVCRTYLDAEDLFCSNCGTENTKGIDAEGIGIEPEIGRASCRERVCSTV